MAVFEGKTSTERNKIIAAAALGLVALIALYMAFGRSLFGGTATTVKVTISPTPKPGVAPHRRRAADRRRTGFRLSDDAGCLSAGKLIRTRSGPEHLCVLRTAATDSLQPDAGSSKYAKTRDTNADAIFFPQYITPPNVYAGSRGFRLEISGDRFTPDARIYFNQSEMPTTFVNPQKVVTDIPANLIAQEGPRQVIVQTPDGKAYSTQILYGYGTAPAQLPIHWDDRPQTL